MWNCQLDIILTKYKDMWLVPSDEYCNYIFENRPSFLFSFIVANFQLAKKKYMIIFAENNISIVILTIFMRKQG